ncbi:hypothetical protein WDU94_006035 [Cyamophila willieti]
MRLRKCGMDIKNGDKEEKKEKSGGKKEKGRGITHCADRQKRQGLIVPPKDTHHSNGTNALYNPSGKLAAPTQLPGGITIPSGPLFAPGKVETKPTVSTPSTNQHQSPTVVSQPHQQQQQQQQQQHNNNNSTSNNISSNNNSSTSNHKNIPSIKSLVLLTS